MPLILWLKLKWVNMKHQNARWFLLVLTLVVTIFIVVLTFAQAVKTQEQVELLSPLASPVVNSQSEVANKVVNSPTPSPTPTPTTAPKSEYVGKASIYSRAGCLGCSENLLMANGQPLDDNALTVAFNDAPLGTQIKITNTHNGNEVTARVTDTGGFKRHGRIVDVTPAVAHTLALKTDQVVAIEVVR